MSGHGDKERCLQEAAHRLLAPSVHTTECVMRKTNSESGLTLAAKTDARTRSQADLCRGPDMSATNEKASLDEKVVEDRCFDAVGTALR